MRKDYYNTLGIDKSATAQEIKKAFRKKAHAYHPDKQGGDEALFKEVNEAYQVLGDDKKRQQYDQFGTTFEGQGGFGSGMGWDDFMQYARGGNTESVNFGVDLGDIFGDMFGFGGRRSAQRAGRNVQVDIDISLREAVDGVARELTLTKPSACDVCSGTGAEPGSPMRVCDECEGQGSVRTVQRTILGAMQSVRECGACHASGKRAKSSCAHCHGSGVTKTAQSVTVKIPAGIHDGATIRIGGHGEYPGAGGAPGDLFVAVHVQPDPTFERDGNDIKTTAHLTFPQAVLGDTIAVDTLEGEKKLVIPPGTQSHQEFRLKNLGVPGLRGGRGHQFVRVIVDVPKKPDRKMKKIVEQLRDVTG
jgi:molecular chaperone DnaJ